MTGPTATSRLLLVRLYKHSGSLCSFLFRILVVRRHAVVVFLDVPCHAVQGPALRDALRCPARRSWPEEEPSCSEGENFEDECRISRNLESGRYHSLQPGRRNIMCVPGIHSAFIRPFSLLKVT